MLGARTGPGPGFQIFEFRNKLCAPGCILDTIVREYADADDLAELTFEKAEKKFWKF